jgi:hypothetical protein
MVSREEVITLIDDAFVKYNNTLNNYFSKNKLDILEEKERSEAELLLEILKSKKDEYDKINYQEDINFIQGYLGLPKDSIVKLSNESHKSLRDMVRMLDLGNRYEIAISYAYDAVKAGISDPDIIKAIKLKLNL